MNFEIISEITNVEIIAVNKGIRELERVKRDHGPGRWRKLKGVATVRRDSGSVKVVELHWYEEQSIGKREFRIKRNLSGDEKL